MRISYIRDYKAAGVLGKVATGSVAGDVAAVRRIGAGPSILQRVCGIASQIAQAHGETLSVESNPAGTPFTLSMPAGN